MSPQGYDEAWSTGKVMEIHNTLLNIFKRADDEAQPTNAVADLMAQEIIARGKK
jgi:hypothetical protein